MIAFHASGKDMEGRSEMKLCKNYKLFFKVWEKNCQSTSWTLFDQQEPPEILKIQIGAMHKGSHRRKEAWCIIPEDGIICKFSVDLKGRVTLSMKMFN